MTDIAPELLKKVQESFEKETEGLKEEIKNGVKSYEEAYSYAIRVGEALSKSFGVNITSEILPDGRMYYNIADKVVRPMLKAEHELSVEAAVSAQKTANKASGIGIKAQKADFDTDRAQGIIDRVSSEPYENVKWLLDEPIKTFAKSTVDKTMQKNIEFQGRSGLAPKIVRRASADACPWCLAVAGTYSYPNVPKDVYRRHANCDCVVEYVDGGKIQDVWTKKLKKHNEHVSIAPRNAKKYNPRTILRKLSAMQDSEKVSVPAEIRGNFEDFASLSISDEEKKELASLRNLSENTGYEHATIYLSNGTTKRVTSELSDRVHIELADEDGTGIQILHSHTNVTPLSGNDFKFLCNRQVDAIGNIAINGDAYVCRVEGGIRPTESEFESDIQRIANEVDSEIIERALVNDWTPEEATYMAIREQAYRVARHYEWKLEGGSVEHE